MRCEIVQFLILGPRDTTGRQFLFLFEHKMFHPGTCSSAGGPILGGYRSLRKWGQTGEVGH